VSEEETKIMDVFFYIDKPSRERVLECGLKLSEWAERKVFLSGIQHSCIKALLNPRDDMKKFEDDKYVPLKIRVNPKTTIIAEGLFYDDSLFDHGMNKFYNDSVIFLDKYIFGMYRRPECLLTGTVTNKFFKEMDRLIDVPVLYDSSEELYVHSQIEKGKEMYGNFNEKLLYRYYKHLEEKGLYKMHSIMGSEYVIFESEENKHIVSVRKV